MIVCGQDTRALARIFRLFLIPKNRTVKFSWQKKSKNRRFQTHKYSSDHIRHLKSGLTSPRVDGTQGTQDPQETQGIQATQGTKGHMTHTRDIVDIGTQEIQATQGTQRKEEPQGTYDPCLYRVFSHDVTAAILVSHNNDTAAMLVSQTNPLGVELFSYANTFFCSNKFA